jgi:hypothetical protein
MRRPSWFEPVDSVGEWIGLLGGLLALGGIVALVVVGGINWKATSAFLDCPSPLDSCNWSAYRVRNDTSRIVVLRECENWCEAGDQLYDPVRLEPGSLSSTDAVIANVNSRAWWEVKRLSGRQLGCLVLNGYSTRHNGELVLVSAARPCSPTQPTTPIRVA